MKTVKGKVLQGEQTLIIFDRRANPGIKKSDKIRVNSKQFIVQRMETHWGTVAAEIKEIDGAKPDYSYFPSPGADSFPLHCDTAELL